MLRLSIAILLALLTIWPLAAQAPVIPYDLVYVRAPRPGGDTALSRMADVFSPFNLEPNSDLMLRHPDGSEEVLVAGGALGAITDPCVSFDGLSVYYSHFPDLSQVFLGTNPPVPLGGADIWRVTIATKAKVQLTHGEVTTSTAVLQTLPYKPFNTGPCPVSGGKVVFTSNRNGFITPKGYTPVVMQLYVMNEDGSNVMPIAPMVLGSALHPFQLLSGDIAWSSKESQGMRDSRKWGMWSIWPDGRMWAPLMSAFGLDGDAFHFATQLTGGDLVVEDYYNTNNNGFGTLYRFPTASPTSSVGFYPAFVAQNPPLAMTNSAGTKEAARYPFEPTGIFSITPFTHPMDQPAAVGLDGVRVGKVTQPSAAPGGDLLLVWTPGPANHHLGGANNVPYYDAGLYVMKGGGPITSPAQLVKIKNDPAYNEQWPRAVVPYSAIMGVPAPHEFPFLPNDGTVDPTLPVGTPYGIIGTSSLYKRESFPGYDIGHAFDGLEPFNTAQNDVNANWFHQGGDVGRVNNADICGLTILVQEPTSQGYPSARAWRNVTGERLRTLGTIPVRKTDANGATVLDPDGNPDTSGWARVPADTPFTFQMADCEGRTLSMAQTWHQVRPGEVRTNCGGCHAHSQAPLSFNATAAAKLPPMDLTASHATDVEFIRDIRPILQRSCASCHQGANAPAKLNLAETQLLTDGSGLPIDYARLAWDRTAQWGIKPITSFGQWKDQQVSRYTRALQSRRSLLTWKIYGERLDGWTNADHPTETTPGDVNTLPGGAGQANVADIDYSDTVNHPAMLTLAEKRAIARWIDTGLLLDQGGAFGDETRPTLALTPSGATLIVGAADAYSGIMGAPTANIDGAAVTLTSLGAGRWSGMASAGSHVVSGTVKDVAGNITTLTRTLQFGTGNPPQPLTLTCAPSQTVLSAVPIAVAYPAPVAGGGTAPVIISSAPASGSVFPLGATTVTGLATDSLGQTASCTLTVTVSAPDPCVVTPLRITAIQWPTGQTGTKRGQWNSGSFALVSASFLWNPQRFEARDTRNCTVTVLK